MKWLSITMLLLAVLQLRVASHPVLLAIVVCASGLLVAAQAVRAGKYSWAIGFLAIAVFSILSYPLVVLEEMFSESTELVSQHFWRPQSRSKYARTHGFIDNKPFAPAQIFSKP